MTSVILYSLAGVAIYMVIGLVVAWILSFSDWEPYFSNRIEKFLWCCLYPLWLAMLLCAYVDWFWCNVKRKYRICAVVVLSSALIIVAGWLGAQHLNGGS